MEPINNPKTENLSLNIIIPKLGRWLIIIYFAGLTLFSAEFAKIKILPFMYTTDLFFLLLSLCVGYIWIRDKKIQLPPFALLMACILFWAVFELIRGLLLYHNVLYSIRQFAPFLYILFIPLIFTVYETKKEVILLLQIIFGLSVITALLYVTGLSGSNYNYLKWVISLAIAAYLYQINQSDKRIQLLIYIGSFILMLGIFSTAVRGAWLGLLVVMGLFLIIPKRLTTQPIWTKSSKNISIVLITLVIAVLLGAFMKPQEILARYNVGFWNQAINATSNNVLISDKEGVAISNSQWRLYVWKDIFHDYIQQPILGYGLGKQFFSQTINKLKWGGYEGDPDVFGNGKNYIGLEPHNSPLHILYMEGIIGFILFEGFFIILFWRYLRDMKINNLKAEQTMFIITLLSGILFIWLLANLEVIMEVPFNVIFLWLFIGLLFVSEKVYKNEEPQHET